MNPSTPPLTYVKFGLIDLVVALIGVFALMRLIDPTAAIASIVATIGSLVFALGISSAGASTATAILAHTRAMVAQADAQAAPDQVRRVVPGPARGFVQLRVALGMAAAGLIAAAFSLAIAALTGGCTDAQRQAIASPVGNFAACAISRLTTDELSGMAQNKVAADIADNCGCPQTGDPAACTATINPILDAEAKRAAMLASRVDAGR